MNDRFVDEESIETARYWADSLYPDETPDLPRYKAVQSALREGRWSEAEAELAASEFGATSQGLHLRMFLACTTVDLPAFARHTDSLNFEDLPGVKLWGLRLTGRAEEATRLLARELDDYGIDRLSGPEEALYQDLEAAYECRIWKLVVVFGERLQILRRLDARETSLYGRALEEEGKPIAAADAYIASYNELPHPYSSAGLARLGMKIVRGGRTEEEARDDDEVLNRICLFAREHRASESDDYGMKTLGFIEAAMSGRWGRTVWMLLQVIGWRVRRNLTRSFRPR